jgi:hypothetical protein
MIAATRPSPREMLRHRADESALSVALGWRLRPSIAVRRERFRDVEPAAAESSPAGP